MNWFWAKVHALGIAPNLAVTMEVTGRHSGRTISLPLAMVVLNGERYVVSMLGANAEWVRNVRAGEGRVRLRHGQVEEVKLEELAVEKRAPVLKAYLRVTPGARPHVLVNKDAPLDEFQAIAAQFPVFRVCSAGERNPQCSATPEVRAAPRRCFGNRTSLMIQKEKETPLSVSCLV